jgi:phosphoglycolate phosphatase/putative hydrolase of the HAD superfamily
MKLFLPCSLSRRGILVFDLDGTLYDNPAYIRFQEESQVKKLADFLHLSYDDTCSRVRRVKQLRKNRCLPPTSLANIFKELGAPFDLIIQSRISEFHPSDWLSSDISLFETLRALEVYYSLAIITNNPHVIAEESLKSLGVLELFNIIVALDDTKKSKPDPAPFKILIKDTNLMPEKCIAIGDRYSIDIEPALREGMNGILIDNVREIYLLPNILLP